jgi:hypothetical protein
MCSFLQNQFLFVLDTMSYSDFNTKNNLIDVPEKTISSFTEASKKITVLKSVVKI